MRMIAYVLIMCTTVVLQSTVMELFKIRWVKPDLPLVFALCTAMVKGENMGAFMGFINGILEDIVYGKMLGFAALIKFLSGYIQGYITRDIFKGPVFLTMIFTFLGTLIYDIILIFFSLIFGQIRPPWYFFIPIVLPSALSNMLISPLVYMAVVKIEKFFDFYFNVKY
ncbi:MAG: rod shape-determining protein MreD [Tepidanaerobacteraceae bacterium]|nr:rod shape-determining protein MreD [Tepidanaerobacteraceae bacterium]